MDKVRIESRFIKEFESYDNVFRTEIVRLMSRINRRSNGASIEFWEVAAKFAVDKASELQPYQAVDILAALASVGKANEEVQKVKLV